MPRFLAAWESVVIALQVTLELSFEVVKAVPLERRSVLLFMPPFAEGFTEDAIFIERDQEDAIEFGWHAGRNADEGGPPTRDSLLACDGEDLVAEADVLLGLSDMRPVFEDGWPAPHRFEERSDLVGAVFGEQVGCGLGVASFPGAAVGVQPRRK